MFCRAPYTGRTTATRSTDASEWNSEMKAIWNDVVVAEAEKKISSTLRAIGTFLQMLSRKNTLSLMMNIRLVSGKVKASYYNVEADGRVSEGGAWYYPQPMSGSIERVKKTSQTTLPFGVVWR